MLPSALDLRGELAPLLLQNKVNFYEAHLLQLTLLQTRHTTFKNDLIFKIYNTARKHESHTRKYIIISYARDQAGTIVGRVQPRLYDEATQQILQRRRHETTTISQ